MTEYATLKDKMRAEKAARLERYQTYTLLWEKAHQAGMAAGNAAACTPMNVCNPATGQTWHVPDGVCGFAWVVHYPATSSFARWAVKNRDARKEYGGGLCLKWVGEFNQSMQRKEAYAQAFAQTLRDAGVDAHSRSRID